MYSLIFMTFYNMYNQKGREGTFWGMKMFYFFKMVRITLMHIFFKTDFKEHYKEMSIPLHVNFTYIL